MKQKHLLLALLLFSTVMIGIFSCKKQSVAEEAKQTYTVEKLAEKFTMPLDQNYQSLKEQYASLGEADLKAFWLDIYRIHRQQGKASLSESEFLKEYEMLSQKSISEFGTGINKLSNENFVKVFAPKEGSNRTITPNFVHPPDGDPGCEFLPYQFYYYWANNPNISYSPPFDSWRIVDFYRGDCNGYEVTYYGNYNKLRAITALGQQSIALFLQGDHITVNGSIRTRVLHKKESVDILFGGVLQINDNIRMANEYLVEGD